MHNFLSSSVHHSLAYSCSEPVSLSTALGFHLKCIFRSCRVTTDTARFHYCLCDSMFHEHSAYHSETSSIRWGLLECAYDESNQEKQHTQLTPTHAHSYKEQSLSREGERLTPMLLPICLHFCYFTHQGLAREKDLHLCSFLSSFTSAILPTIVHCSARSHLLKPGHNQFSTRNILFL